MEHVLCLYEYHVSLEVSYQLAGILFSGTVDGHVNGWSLSQNRRSHRIPLLDRRERTNTLTAMDVLESGTMAVGFSSGRTVLVDVRYHVALFEF